MGWNHQLEHEKMMQHARVFRKVCKVSLQVTLEIHMLVSSCNFLMDKDLWEWTKNSNFMATNQITFMAMGTKKVMTMDNILDIPFLSMLKHASFICPPKPLKANMTRGKRQPFEDGISYLKWWIFHCYVCLPEGTGFLKEVIQLDSNPGIIFQSHSKYWEWHSIDVQLDFYVHGFLGFFFTPRVQDFGPELPRTLQNWPRRALWSSDLGGKKPSGKTEPSPWDKVMHPRNKNHGWNLKPSSRIEKEFHLPNFHLSFQAW